METTDYEKNALKVLKNESFWDQDLTKIDGLREKIALALQLIDSEGTEEGFDKFAAGFTADSAEKI